jgi:hypothetical protein
MSRAIHTCLTYAIEDCDCAATAIVGPTRNCSLVGPAGKLVQMGLKVSDEWGSKALLAPRYLRLK